MAMRDSVTESLTEFAFSFRLCSSLFLVTFQAFMNELQFKLINKGCYELKNRTHLIEICMRESNYYMFFTEANISKVF